MAGSEVAYGSVVCICMIIIHVVTCVAEAYMHHQHHHHNTCTTNNPGIVFPYPPSLCPAPEISMAATTEPIGEIAVDYGDEVCERKCPSEEICITFDDRGGARWRSLKRFAVEEEEEDLEGEVSAWIKCPAGNTSGLNCSFYLSTLEGNKEQDEIDFEFLGKDKFLVQTNFYVCGVGGREVLHPLSFDSSADFHLYAIRWSPASIEWLIDGSVVRHEVRACSTDPFPCRPMFLYASIWNASYIDDGRWAGPYDGSDSPYVCSYRQVRVPAAHH